MSIVYKLQPVRSLRPGLVFTRHLSSSGSWIVNNKAMEEKLDYVTKVYEDFVGLTEVKAAQAKVIEAETKFKEAQEQRVSQQQRMLQLQKQLREIHTELDKTVRGEDRYLQLITKEHQIIREDRAILEQFRTTEKLEHDYFSLLSFALRESHEKERAQGEKTKYWSIIGSITGTVIGIVATTANNQYRLHQLRKLVTEASSETLKCHDIILELKDTLQEQTSILRESKNSSIETLTAHLNEPCSELHQLEDVVKKYSLINTAIVSAGFFLVVPLTTWLMAK